MNLGGERQNRNTCPKMEESMKPGEKGPNPSPQAYEHASDQARFKRPEDAADIKKSNKSQHSQKAKKKK